MMIPEEYCHQLSNINDVHANEYIYLEYLNIINGLIHTMSEQGFGYTADFSSIINKKNKIYSNGGCYVSVSPNIF
jgi:uncharacterized membrane protein